MRERIATSSQSEKGSIFVYFALILVVLLGFGAIALDGSNAYVQKRQMQNAADAAALAGARAAALGETNGQIDYEVNRLATANDAQQVSWQFTADGHGIEVTTETTFDTAFARLFGLDTMTARAVSEVAYGAPESMDNLLPMAATCEERTYGETYRIWDKEMEAPGNFGWLDWNGVPVGNNELVQNLLHPSNSGVWHIGDLIPAGPGVKNSSGVRNALNQWIGHNVTIPLYDQITGHGANARYRVCGFAEFVLTGYYFHGCHKWVEGYFIRTIETGGTVSTSATDYGIELLYFRK
ncbi:MAG: hypothetical protein GXP38_04370 [Chloroflexi bacterium]|nr:hypothetical protein [Chloroflexota bacterium]